MVESRSDRQGKHRHRRCAAKRSQPSLTNALLAPLPQFHSLVYGRPYIILQQHCDVELPTNMYQRDLTAEGPSAKDVKDVSEVTEMSKLP